MDTTTEAPVGLTPAADTVIEEPKLTRAEKRAARLRAKAAEIEQNEETVPVLSKVGSAVVDFNLRKAGRGIKGALKSVGSHIPVRIEKAKDSPEPFVG